MKCIRCNSTLGVDETDQLCCHCFCDERNTRRAHDQTYIEGTAPQPATGPWTADMDALESGMYLGESEHGELGIYGYSNPADIEEDEDLDENSWLNMQTLEPADPPKRVARIYR